MLKVLCTTLLLTSTALAHQGFYAGVQAALDVERLKGQTNEDNTNIRTFDKKRRKFMPGIYGGYNWMMNESVYLGADLEINLPPQKFNKRLAITSGTHQTAHDVRFRRKVDISSTFVAGYKVTKRFDVFAKFGLNLGNEEIRLTTNGNNGQRSDTASKDTIRFLGGLGIKANFEKTSVKLEYNYLSSISHKIRNLSDDDTSGLGKAYCDLDLKAKPRHIFKIGIQYNF